MASQAQYDAYFTTLGHTRGKAADIKYCLKKLESRINSFETFVSDHLESVRQDAKATFTKRKRVKTEDEIRLIKEEAGEEIRFVNEKRADEIRLINEEADEKIRLFNEKRDVQIKECLKKGEEQEEVFSDDQQEVLSDIEKISETINEDDCLDEMKRKNAKKINDVDDIKCRIEQAKKNYRPNDIGGLVTEIGQQSATLEELSSINHDTAAYAYLDKLQHEVQNVQFLGGQLNGEYYARVDGYVGKWELVKSVAIPSDVRLPLLVGQITNESVCVRDGTNNDVYVTNISNGNSEKIFDAYGLKSSLLETGWQLGFRFHSCIRLDSSILVYGGRSRIITVHDRQWKWVRDITMPKSTDLSELYFDVDKNGMILAAEYGESKIYVINPVDDKIVDTIVMQDVEVFSKIQALSSGDIYVVEQAGLTLVSRSGEKRTSIDHCHDWYRADCHVDKLTDTCYIRYLDEDLGIYVVDQVSRHGNFEARRIIEYEKHYSSDVFAPIYITPSGNLLVRSGHNLLIYKKKFVVGYAGTRPEQVYPGCTCGGCVWNRAAFGPE